MGAPIKWSRAEANANNIAKKLRLAGIHAEVTADLQPESDADITLLPISNGEDFSVQVTDDGHMVVCTSSEDRMLMHGEVRTVPALVQMIQKVRSSREALEGGAQ